MDAADLVQLAQARGIDLKHIAGVASDTKGPARRRALTLVEKKLGLRDVQETVTGRQSRVYRRPTWSVAELGQAANGLGPIPWAAALYSFAGARDGYFLLKNALAAEAIRFARREHWPPHVLKENGSAKNYCEDLAELVLLEDANRHLFLAAPQLYAIVLEVTPEVWVRQLNDPFRSLKTSYERWLETARAVIARWIREPNHNPESNSIAAS